MTECTAGSGINFIQAEKIIDGTGKVIGKEAILVTEYGRIKEVGMRKDIPLPEGVVPMNFDDCTLIPGMFDCHLHLGAQNIHNFVNYRTATFEITPQLQQMYAYVQAQMCFEMGFTTLRDQSWITPWGLFTEEMVAVRDAINQGILPGPRILAGGWAVITNAHLELLLPQKAQRPPGVTADGPWELRKMVRTQLRAGVDHIKICASGGGGTDSQHAGGVINMSQEEIQAVIEEAHLMQTTCACHAWFPQSQISAMRAGVDTLEHIVQTNDEAIAMMVATETPLVPTLAVRTDHAMKIMKQAGASDFVLANYRRYQGYCFENFKKLHQAGVKIACGTDLNIWPEMGNNAIELEQYVELGMTPMEALQSATRNAAQALHMDADLGTLEKGKLADVVAVAGNPLDDIGILRRRENIRMVMKAGEVCVDKRSGRDERVIHRSGWDWPRLGESGAGGCCRA
jgi:imidazolonepropionase-like amidohydrolase